MYCQGWFILFIFYVSSFPLFHTITFYIKIIKLDNDRLMFLWFMIIK